MGGGGRGVNILSKENSRAPHPPLYEVYAITRHRERKSESRDFSHRICYGIRGRREG